MNPTILLFASLAALGVATAQNRSVVPSACEALPGNAALSLPLRWSEGTLQVRIDATLLPANFIGKTISGLRLRRPTFLREPAYPGLQRTLTVRGGFDPRLASTLNQSLLNNRPQAPNAWGVLFGPAVVPVPATPATGPDSHLGDEFVVLPFTTPLLVIAGNLFLEFEATDGPFQVGADHWVDAVWFEYGIETGYAVTVGDGSCTTRSMPTELTWNDPGTGPVVGGTAAFRLAGATPGAFVYSWFGLDPIPRAATLGYPGFGGSLTGLDPTLTGCHQWAPLDAVWSGVANPGGVLELSFGLVQGATTAGLRIGVQSAWLDLNRPGLPISVSNGVMLVLANIAVGDDCACAYFPGTTTFSPWNPFLGQMPVVILEHN